MVDRIYEWLRGLDRSSDSAAVHAVTDHLEGLLDADDLPTLRALILELDELRAAVDMVDKSAHGLLAELEDA